MIARRWSGVVVAAVIMAACGKKGPPLPPLRPAPVAPTEMSARVVGDRLTLRFMIPAASENPDSPAVIERVDVYARSVGFGGAPPEMTDFLKRENRVGSIEVRPPVDPELPPVDPATPKDPRPGPGELTTWSETLPAVPVVRSERGRSQPRPFALPLPPTSLTVPFVRLTMPARYYAVVGVSTRGHTGPPSILVPVRVGTVPPPPTDLQVKYNETTLTLTWTPPPGLGVSVYESNAQGVESAAPVQGAPITSGTWSTPVTFDAQRCFTARTVRTDGPVSVESTPAGPRCETPVDTFPPPAPQKVNGAVETGRIRLEWEPVSVPDLAGYTVLRAEGPDATLQPVTKALETGSTYSDTTVKPGVDYWYVIVAVDNAGNVSARSDPRVRFTAR